MRQNGGWGRALEEAPEKVGQVGEALGEQSVEQGGSPGSELGAHLLSRLPWSQSEGKMLGAVVTDTSACFVCPQGSVSPALL